MLDENVILHTQCLRYRKPSQQAFESLARGIAFDRTSPWVVENSIHHHSQATGKTEAKPQETVRQPKLHNSRLTGKFQSGQQEMKNQLTNHSPSKQTNTSYQQEVFGSSYALPQSSCHPRIKIPQCVHTACTAHHITTSFSRSAARTLTIRSIPLCELPRLRTLR